MIQRCLPRSLEDEDDSNVAADIILVGATDCVCIFVCAGISTYESIIGPIFLMNHVYIIVDASDSRPLSCHVTHSDVANCAYDSDPFTAHFLPPFASPQVSTPTANLKGHNQPFHHIENLPRRKILHYQLPPGNRYQPSFSPSYIGTCDIHSSEYSNPVRLTVLMGALGFAGASREIDRLGCSRCVVTAAQNNKKGGTAVVGRRGKIA